MIRCLSEEALHNHLGGESSDEEHAHLRTCLACSRRYKALEQDLDLLKGALSGAPPLDRRSSSRSGLSITQLAVGALAASLLVFATHAWTVHRLSIGESSEASVSVEDGDELMELADAAAAEAPIESDDAAVMPSDAILSDAEASALDDPFNLGCTQDSYPQRA